MEYPDCVKVEPDEHPHNYNPNNANHCPYNTDTSSETKYLLGNSVNYEHIKVEPLDIKPDPDILNAIPNNSLPQTNLDHFTEHSATNENRDATKHFIEAIRERPAIWMNTRDYLDKTKQLQSWIEVLSIMEPNYQTFTNFERNIKILELQKRWNKLKNGFMIEWGHELMKTLGKSSEDEGSLRQGIKRKLDEPPINTYKAPLSEEKIKFDDDDAFFRQCANYMKALPLDVKLMAKVQITQVIIESMRKTKHQNENASID